MNINETNKSRIPALLKIALEQKDVINSITLQVSDDFDISKFVPYLLNDKWPYAVDPLLIADPDSEDDQISRAYGILSVVVTEPVTGRFLDFGCGEGYVVSEVAKKAVKSVGYDIKDHQWQRFPKSDNMIFTLSWDEVVNNGPYDSVLICDVLDHLKDENEAIQELKKINDVLDSKGKVFIRCHPWCSRHGTHLYKSINRAYLHLIVSENDLNAMGYEYLHTIKIIHPLQTYDKWFSNSGFKIEHWNITSENIDPFFYQSAIANLIKRNWKESPEEDFASGKKFPEWQMKQQFVDYVLKKKL